MAKIKATHVLYDGDQVRAKLLNGVNALADIVQVTLGPKGRNVMIQKKWGWPHTTKDGVTVARDVFLSDYFENMGAMLLKHVAGKTCEDAGDGTTTSTILARALFRDGAKLVSAGHNPMEIKKGIDWAVSQVVEKLKDHAKPLETFEQVTQVATISANGDEAIGKIIANAMEAVGKEGVITIDEGGNDTTLDVTEGMQFDQGWLHYAFITDPSSGQALMDDVRILVYNGVLRYQRELMPILEKVAAQNKPILIIAEDVIDQALTLLVVNRQKGQLACCAVRSPGFGDRRIENLTDIAVMTGATIIDPSLSKIEDADLSDLGFAERVIVDQTNTTILKGAGDENQINLRAEKIKKDLEGLVFKPEIERLNRRLARLIGGVGVISVGAATETEMKERKDRVDDALSATRAAVEEGIVPGGGITLYRIARNGFGEAPTGSSRDFAVGVELLKKACEEPLRAIVRNAGLEAAEILAKVRTHHSFTYGFDARKEEYTDMVEAGIIDPAKVIRSSLQNAASAAGLLLTTEGMIAEEPDDKE